LDRAAGAGEEGIEMATFRPDEDDSVYIGQGAELTGAIKASGAVVIDGSFDGEIACGHLLVGETGMVKGTVEAETADISGHVNADLTTRHLLAVGATGRVEGKWDCGALEVTRGGVLNGSAHVVETASGRGRVAEPAEAEEDTLIEEDEAPAPVTKLEPRRAPKLNLRTPRRSVG
jgi:cytoskeletal protein CcmA (bactofilin family)